MMKTLETSLWRWLLRGKPESCLLERVENRVSAGTPDVLGVYRGNCFVCELKVRAVDRSKVLHDSGLTPEQADFLLRFHKAGGSAWVLMQIDVGRYLIPAGIAATLMQPVHVYDLLQLAVAHPSMLTAVKAIEIMAR